MPVRSARLGVGNTDPANVEHVLVSCPPGRTLLVKDIRLECNGAVPFGGLFLVSGARRVSVFFGSFTTSEIRSSTGFIVLEPGDEIRIFADAGRLSFWVSGAELEGVAP